MADATATAKVKAKPSSTFEAPKDDTPRFDIPNFEAPKMEVPAAFREFAEKGLSQARQSWDRMKEVTEEATDVLESSYSTASKGGAEYGLKLIDITRANTNAAFDFASELFAAKSFSDAVELTTAHSRKQFDALSAQAKELTALAQKVANESAEPIKSGVTAAFQKVA
jgi:phasin